MQAAHLLTRESTPVSTEYAHAEQPAGPIMITPTYDHGRGCWIAYLYQGGLLQTSASGRDEGAAVADAVARFRTSRMSRRAA